MKPEAKQDRKYIQPNIAIANLYFLIAGLATVFFIAFFYFVVQNLILTAVMFLILIAVLANYIIFRRTKNYKIATYVLLSMGAAIMFCLFAGGWENMGLIWPFAWLPATFWMAEGKSGRVFMFVFFTGSLLITALHFAGIIPLPYSPIALVNFFAALVVFSILMILYQNSALRYEKERDKAEQEIRALNITLDQRVQKRTGELETANNQLTVQNKQLEDFCHIIAHNLRAPLSNLLLLTDMIQKSKSTEKQLQYLEKQETALSTLNETFEKLVSSIRVREDTAIERDSINLTECLENAIKLLQGEIIETKAVISKDISKTATIYFPKKYLNSILLNLLGNALKYRSPDRIPEIHIKSYEKNDWTYLEVKDNGLGIDLKRHGDKLFRLNKTFHPHPNAKGFGLFITKTQIDAMGGHIRAESAPGQGSTFIVKLNKNK